MCPDAYIETFLGDQELAIEVLSTTLIRLVLAVGIILFEVEVVECIAEPESEKSLLKLLSSSSSSLLISQSSVLLPNFPVLWSPSPLNCILQRLIQILEKEGIKPELQVLSVRSASTESQGYSSATSPKITEYAINMYMSLICI